MLVKQFPVLFKTPPTIVLSMLFVYRRNVIRLVQVIICSTVENRRRRIICGRILFILESSIPK